MADAHEILLMGLVRAHPGSSSRELTEMAVGHGLDFCQAQLLLCRLLFRGRVIESGRRQRSGGRHEPLYSLPLMLDPQLAKRLLATGSLMALCLEAQAGSPGAAAGRGLPEAWRRLAAELLQGEEARPCG